MGPGEGGVSDTPRSNTRPSNLGEGPGQGLQHSSRSVLAWGEGHFKGEGQLEKIDVTADNGHADGWEGVAEGWVPTVMV